MHNPSYLFNGNGAFSLGNAQLAEGTNAHTIQTAAAVDFSIGNLLYSKAATDNIAMTALTAQAALTSCLYLVTINASGTVAIAKGTEHTTGSGENLEWPSVPANEAVLGGFRIDTAAATTFTSGTTDLSAAGITDTFYNFIVPTNNLLA